MDARQEVIRIRSKERFVEKKCIYGEKTFCDGTPNKSVERSIRRDKCKYYINGKCKLQEEIQL